MFYAIRYLREQLRKNIFLNNDGAAVIEYAILLPSFVLLVLGAAEFGADFLKNEIANNAVNTVSQNIQNDPTFYSSLNSKQLATLEKSYGSGIIDFTKPGNYLCVQAFTTAAAAATAGPCTSTSLAPATPNPAGQAYYISVGATLPKGGITPLVNLIGGVKQIQVARSSGSVQVSNNSPSITCNQAGYLLQYNPGQTQPWQCVPFNQSSSGTPCSQPWQKLTYNSSTSSFSCVNVPYVFAGGVGWPTTQAGSNSFWDGTNGVEEDISYASWVAAEFPGGAIPYATICTPITFTVPANLPAGQILAQGNLIYPGATNSGYWKSWAVSFMHLNYGSGPPTGTTPYSGSADLCMSNGGNYASGKPQVSSEHISWSLIFIPD